ncbi:HAD family hydrolase [Lacisediminihabitans changchengi]|uniref:HAD family hydrolase n=1 Tax=Lacisediminihabitans changchengi TaxID=2787634 RepID=A0A934SG90_9MICO|nr:HAD family hydrolase [Lacisediminihabitans changchengi]MBK4346102.1 HAD family hydrolase [Lacisediminihabitans changchengi]
MVNPAVLFDIDGTLVDSNYAHVAAWSRALEEVGHPVDSWRIHRGIGMDSDLLLDELLGGRAEDLGDRASALNSEHYLAAAGSLRAFAHARELVSAVADLGLQVVLATSAPNDELQLLRSVLGIEEDLALVTSAGDVEQAKPAPDIVQVAIARAGVEPARAIMVGDSIWDVRGAASAGVACIGLLSGGTGRLELLEAGAIAVYDDAGDLLAHLADSAIAALAR